MSEYENLKSSSIDMEERNDCAVKAYAAASGHSYYFVHDVMVSHGRRPRQGATKLTMHLAAETLGMTLTAVKFKGRTIRTVARQLPSKGTYLLHTASHVAAYVNGRVEDWTAGRLHRVYHVEKVKTIDFEG